jgi:hypothetical protein
VAGDGHGGIKFSPGLKQLEALPTGAEIDRIEVRLRRHLERVRVLKLSFRSQLIAPAGSNQALTQAIRQLLEECDLHERHILPESEDKSLTGLRRLQMALQDIEQKNEIELKLIRNFQQESL